MHHIEFAHLVSCSLVFKVTMLLRLLFVFSAAPEFQNFPPNAFLSYNISTISLRALYLSLLRERILNVNEPGGPERVHEREINARRIAFCTEKRRNDPRNCGPIIECRRLD